MKITHLTERQEQILALLIREYIETAQPVSSNRLVERYGLKVSSATVRIELVTLTEVGYLRKPYTSAGRVPTENGYRYFVRQLMGHEELPATTKRTIVHQFYQIGPDINRRMRLAASVLARQAQAASLVTAPRSERNVYKHLELISIHGRQALMVLVMKGGEVSQQRLALAEPVTQDQLSKVSQRLNGICHELDADQINEIPAHLDALENDVQKLVVDAMRRFGSLSTGEIYRDGLSHVLSEPEFGESGAARNALRVLEERPLLDDILTRTVLASESGGVHVVIGGEGTWEELRDCSVVLARYGEPGLAIGTLGVLGPIRMSYARTISTVRFMANLMSDLVTDAGSE